MKGIFKIILISSILQTYLLSSNFFNTGLESIQKGETIEMEFEVKPETIKVVKVKTRIKKNECDTLDKTKNFLSKVSISTTGKIENFVKEANGKEQDINYKEKIKEIDKKCKDVIIEEVTKEFEHTYNLNGIIIKKTRPTHDDSKKKINIEIKIEDI
ncbi:hypothetical protein HOK00_06220 [bacterium]|nr:hypothetical protein [bacterium]